MNFIHSGEHTVESSAHQNIPNFRCSIKRAMVVSVAANLEPYGNSVPVSILNAAAGLSSRGTQISTHWPTIFHRDALTSVKISTGWPVRAGLVLGSTHLPLPAHEHQRDIHCEMKAFADLPQDRMNETSAKSSIDQIVATAYCERTSFNRVESSGQSRNTRKQNESSSRP